MRRKEVKPNTVNFVREVNSINEYTSSSFDDATGEYIMLDDMLDLIDSELSKLDDNFKATNTDEENCCIAQQVKSLVSLRNILTT